MAKSPKSTFEPRRAMPRLWPFCILRNFVLLGESIAQASSGLGAALDGRATRAALEDLTLEDPALDADDSVLGPRLGEAELDVRAERVERDAPLTVGLDTAHFAPAEAAGAANAD